MWIHFPIYSRKTFPDARTHGRTLVTIPAQGPRRKTLRFAQKRCDIRIYGCISGSQILNVQSSWTEYIWSALSRAAEVKKGATSVSTDASHPVRKILNVHSSLTEYIWSSLSRAADAEVKKVRHPNLRMHISVPQHPQCAKLMDRIYLISIEQSCGCWV